MFTKMLYMRVGEYEIVDENTFNKDDKECRYYNSITKRQCERANLCFCQFKDPKSDCVKTNSGQKRCSEYQVN